MSESVRKVNLIDSNSLSDNQKAHNQPGNARVGIGVNNTENVQSFARNIAQIICLDHLDFSRGPELLLS